MAVTEYIRTQVPLAPYTTLHVGGAAEFFIETDSREKIREAVLWAKERELKIHCLGGGSNVLIADEGVQGLIIHITNTELVVDTDGTDNLVTAGAGMMLDALVAYCVEREWWGLENLTDIPGTVGATPVQNVGAYGVEVSDCIDTVEVYDCVDDAFKVLSHASCEFSYRDSFFKRDIEKRYIITTVTFRLSKKAQPRIGYKDLERFFKSKSSPTLIDIRNAVRSIRATKFPNWHDTGTAGSFFKNPVITRDMFRRLREKHADIPGFEMGDDYIKIPFGYVLDKVFNLKGVQEGHVGLYKDQALVLVCDREATAVEIKNFAQKIIDRTKNELHIIVEREVCDM